MIVDDLGRIPMSQHLAATLARAASYADAQQHPEVTLEHLLLALAEDTDAAGVLRSSNVDLARLAGEVSTHIGQIDARRDPNGPSQVLISHDLKRILEAAAAAARQGRRAEINGAIVLAAIVGDGKSTAAHLLRVQGLTFEQAIRALQRAAASPPRPDSSPQPSPHGPPGAQQGSTEDILANARERVQSRSVQGQPNQGPAVQQGPPSVAQPAPMPPSPFQQPAPPYGEPPSPPRPEFRPEIRPEIRPDPQQRDPAQSPIAPQWEPANQMPPPPREVPVTQPAVRTGPTPGGPVQQPPPYQMPPQQRTQPPGLPPVPRQGAPAPGGGMMPPQPMAQGGPPPSLGQPQGRGQPPMPPQQRPPQGGPPGPGGPPPQQRQRAGAPGNVRVASGQLVENIPRKMRMGVSMVVEARVARSEVKAIAEGLQGGGAVYRHEVTVTKAMSVRLRSPDGGFFIETSSPETQWIENVLGLMADDFASWRWTITPRERGKQRLQLLISARTIGADGLTAETALPDQMIEVKVSVNYAKTAARWAGWMTAAVAGGVLARFGEGLFEPLVSLLRGSGGG